MTSTNPANEPNLSGTAVRAPLVETRQIARRDPQRDQVLLHPTDFALRTGERATLKAGVLTELAESSGTSKTSLAPRDTTPANGAAR